MEQQSQSVLDDQEHSVSVGELLDIPFETEQSAENERQAAIRVIEESIQAFDQGLSDLRVILHFVEREYVQQVTSRFFSRLSKSIRSARLVRIHRRSGVYYKNPKSKRVFEAVDLMKDVCENVLARMSVERPYIAAAISDHCDSASDLS
jgi:hypothetical protein